VKEIYFAEAALFTKWLVDNHAEATELLVGFYKVGSGKPSMTWPESVDAALSFGWIDGVRRRIDDESYSIRFSPRRAGSVWSAVNIRKAEELISAGLMQPAGLASFEDRKPDRSKIYAYENDPVELSTELEKLFRANKLAWAFFNDQAPSYQRTIRHWIMRAARPKTRLARLEKAISESAQRKRVS
jgi:uncharacterized protein YdeI (YjbR/CyaY-like superfamily)